MKIAVTTLILSVFAISSSAHAELSEYQIAVRDHRFEPAALEIPAGSKIKLIVKNHDTTPEEFESYDFNREKVIDAQGEISLFVGPLEPGE